MADFAVTSDVLERISNITGPYLRDLSRDIAEEFSEQPDMALTIAIGFAVGMLLGSLSDPGERMSAVNGINLMVSKLGFALTPVQ